MINFKFNYENTFGIYLHWNNDDSKFYNLYHPYQIEGFVIFHMEGDKVVEDYYLPINTYNVRNYEKVLKFPNITITKIPVHRNLQVKAIAKEQLFIAKREPTHNWEHEYLFIHRDLVGLEKVYFQKHYLFDRDMLPKVNSDRANYEIISICECALGEFRRFVTFDSTEYSRIESYYNRAIEHWKDKGPDGVVGIEDKIKLLQLMVNDIKRAMSRWENEEPEDILQEYKMLIEDENISMQWLGVKDFWKGGED